MILSEIESPSLTTDSCTIKGIRPVLAFDWAFSRPRHEAAFVMSWTRLSSKVIEEHVRLFRESFLFWERRKRSEEGRGIRACESCGETLQKVFMHLWSVSSNIRIFNNKWAILSPSTLQLTKILSLDRTIHGACRILSLSVLPWSMDARGQQYRLLQL